MQKCKQCGTEYEDEASYCNTCDINLNDTVDSVNEINQINTIARISLAGGLIGALTTNPRQALNNTIEDYNARGWKATHIESHKTHNLFIFFLQFLVLVLTLGLYTWGGGYLVLFERVK